VCLLSRDGNRIRQTGASACGMPRSHFLINVFLFCLVDGLELGKLPREAD